MMGFSAYYILFRVISFNIVGGKAEGNCFQSVNTLVITLYLNHLIILAPSTIKVKGEIKIMPYLPFCLIPSSCRRNLYTTSPIQESRDLL